LTVAEVAEMLKLNQQTIRNWIDQGTLPALRVGRRVRIRRSDLDRKLEEGATIVQAAGSTSTSAEDFWGGEPVGIAEPADGDPVGIAEAAAGEPIGIAEPSARPRPGIAEPAAGQPLGIAEPAAHINPDRP
jgi:excisionase family DNA binding protein